jgi:hypothetical protein
MAALDPLAVGISIGLLVLVFARAALHKAADYGEFRQTVVDYRLLPEKIAGPIAAALTGGEILAIVLLLVPGFRGIGAIVAALLLLGYGAAMAINLARGRTSIDCGCGGPGQSISWALVGRNMLLAGLAVLAAAPIVARPLSAFDIVLMPTVLVAAWLLLLVAERLIQTFSHMLAVGTDRRGY